MKMKQIDRKNKKNSRSIRSFLCIFFQTHCVHIKNTHTINFLKMPEMCSKDLHRFNMKMYGELQWE